MFHGISFVVVVFVIQGINHGRAVPVTRTYFTDTRTTKTETKNGKYRTKDNILLFNIHRIYNPAPKL